MIPSSTYRLQLGPAMTFDQVAEIADYLAALGVGAVYASPVLAATPGSTHGYDVVDPSIASPALGGEDARMRLVGELQELELGLVVDIVPNHMGIADPSANRWWWDVLANGRSSRYAKYFDIDWDSGPVLVPVLGSDALDELSVADGELRYHEHRFPIADGTAGGTPQQVHERQHYRLVNWRRGNTELNYRRFFDITTLAAVRVEDPEVFEATHSAVLRWISNLEVTGLRIDHPDGLANPGEYLRRLRSAAPSAWIVAEKILGADETLPSTWPVHGTTGYDALRLVCGLFIDPAGEPAFSELAGNQDLHAMEADRKRWVAEHLLRAEVRRISRLGVPEQAVIDFLPRFGVYRSYVADGIAENLPSGGIGERMMADPPGELTSRIEQTAAMVMAKGVEDTTFYRYNRFVALNEVGSDPGRFGVPVAEFHAKVAAATGTGMTALSTHDTKRSEDVRARLAVLSELPGEFAEKVRLWTAKAGLSEPTLNLLAWQTIVGAWPISADRLAGYLEKASREAKIATSWTDRNDEFDAEVAAWPDRVLAELGGEIEEFVGRVRGPGWSNSLGQKLLQLAMPGVPDVYQGTELWDYSLVDPDNRRPVDFELRREILAGIEDAPPPIDESGAAKLHVVSRTLRLRWERPELFTGYAPIEATGPAAEHLVGFSRNGLIAVATRLPVGLERSGGWRDTTLTLQGDWTDALVSVSAGSNRPKHSREVLVSELFSRYPVALLVRSGE
ncbi:malto-oligosyltrehalose synthase [Kibdelosporangium phytohabitans]|uniref:Maltooligosyl trehalose synthase n=1 Tax=Kibdelosporangium phytohabitans TaxID=860235 RepID=A0A0N9HXE5_9PSEU|nr:malto-oligosyltrehalose synthase [Kibdelosporangium phytohabitans]ALG08094.1 maltooligosyl trehalose synthase [Kibdelosporangium phytohabitans]MBE1470930.1 (1->4)-alpha-D-glucan 1-alpha-D-glucosylmutase [Kibdelosporangium phytohabitans]